MLRVFVLTSALLATGVAAAQNNPGMPNQQLPATGNPNPQTPMTGAPNQQLPGDPNSAYAAAPPTFAPAPDNAPPQVIRVSGAIMEHEVLNKVEPVYPAKAKSERVQGAVVLAVRIGRDGSVQDLQPVSGPRELGEAAIDAVKQWTYRPYLLNGRPVEVNTTVTVTFQLSGPPHTS